MAEIAPASPPAQLGWTIETYAAHVEAMRAADSRYLEARDRFLEERDRRYTEVNIEREKALKIKEEADRAALELERLSRDYKDEKANNLREQIGGERGLYATKDDLSALGDKFETAFKPIAEFMALQRGGRTQALDSRSLVFAVFGVIGVVAGIVIALAK